MPAPIHRLKKTEILWLAAHYCTHRHTYLDHYQCFLEEKPNTERVGFFDIEASNLNADFGIMLTWCIKPSDSDIIVSDVLTLKDIQRAKAGDEDKRIVKSLIDAMMKFDKIVGYYSSRFDVPFIRTRALSCQLDFPHYGSLKHQDLYFLIRNRFKMSSNRLENACRVLLGKTDKTRIDNAKWRGAARGDKESLDFVLEHNEFDVLDLEKLYNKVIDFGRKTETSL